MMNEQEKEPQISDVGTNVGTNNQLETQSVREGICKEIPKQIFFFWGNEDMSWMRYMTLKSFRMFNKSWKMILYKYKSTINSKPWDSFVEQDFFKFRGIDYTPLIAELDIEIRYWSNDDIDIKNTDISPSHMSNFFKWHTLYSEGGIYSDLDILYFKSIDDFYETLLLNGYDTAICETNYLSIGFLASAKNNDFFKDMLTSCRQNYDPKVYQSAGVLSIYKLFDTTMDSEYGKIIKLAKEKYPNHKFYNIPFQLVYPLGHKQIEYAFTNDLKILDLPQDTIAYHWYAAHPIAQKYNSILTESNYHDFNITYTNIAKEILIKGLRIDF